MKALLGWPLSSDRMWEFCVLAFLLVLGLEPPMAHPRAFALALGGVLVLLLFKRIPRDSFQRLGWPWCLFLLYVALSSFWSRVPGLTLRSAGFLFAGSLLYLMASSREEEKKKRLETWVLALAVGAALAALYQWIWGFEELKFALPGLSKQDFREVGKAIFYRRPWEPLTTPGSLAALMILSLPLGAVLSRVSTGSKSRLFGAATVLLLGVLGLTGSVGAWTSLAAALLLVLFLRRAWGAMAWTLLGAGLAVGAILWARGLSHWSVSSLGMRSLLWGSAWELFLHSPFLGSGLGTFDVAYQEAGFSMVQGGARYAHDLLFQMLSETGLVGTLLVAASLVDWTRRFQLPPRWEGWGVLTGTLAFFLFSFLDLPFQMPELVWAFVLLLGRLELRPTKAWPLPVPGDDRMKEVLFLILLISGFWPPFRPWNLALLACGLWAAAAFFQEKFDRVPVALFLGGIYLAVRAFLSPSAQGAVWFLESAGMVLAFFLFQKGNPKPNLFLKFFLGLGLLWAARIWIHSFQSSDIRDWTLFPNPKQVGLFLLGLFFLRWGPRLASKRPFEKAGWDILLGAFTVATLFCLKAFGAMVALVLGAFTALRGRWRWTLLPAALLIAGILAYRVTVFRDLDANPTHWDRLDIWVSALLVWTKAPFLGAGPGAFAGLYHQVPAPRTQGVSRWLMDPVYVHNEPLEALVAFGLVGLAVAVLFLGWLGLPKEEGKRSGFVALGVGSLFDFCLHTPLLALQGTALLTSEGGKKQGSSWTSAFLAGGLALGLFGSAAYAPVALERSVHAQAENRLPESLRWLETAAKLNAWDARVLEAQADLLERLYVATQDKTWRSRSDEVFARALDLERTDGQLFLRSAERSTLRLDLDGSPEAVQQAEQAWHQAQFLLPYNAFEDFEEGLFWLKKGDKRSALEEFGAAAQKEPNFAAAWMNAGMLLKEQGRREDARLFFGKALEAYERWKGAQRIDPLEKRLVDLSPDAVKALRREVGR